MHSIIKIYSEDLQNKECKSFSFTAKGYEKAYGILVCGQGEVSLVFNKNNRVFANSFDISTGKNLEPNKRALTFKKKLKEEFISGNVTKTKANGIISVYLILE